MITVEGDIESATDERLVLRVNDESIEVAIPPSARVLPDRRAVRAGEHAIAHGEGQTEVTGGAFREAAVARLTAVTATIVACGENAAQLFSEALLGALPDDFKTARRRSTSVEMWRGFCVAGIFVALVTIVYAVANVDDVPLTFDVIVCATGVGIQCIVTRHLLSKTLGFASGRGSIDNVWKPVVITMVGLVGVFVPTFVMSMGDHPSNLYEGQRVYVGIASASIVLGWMVILLITMCAVELRSARLALKLLTTREVSIGRIFRASEKMFGMELAAASLMEEEYAEGSSPNTRKYTTRLGSFTLVRDDGKRVQVTLDEHSYFGSTYRAHLSDGATVVDKKVVIWADVVPNGSPAIVGGEVVVTKDGFAMDGTFATPVTVFASERPRRALFVRLATFAAIVVLLVAAAGTIAYFIADHPFLPPYHAAPSSD